MSTVYPLFNRQGLQADKKREGRSSVDYFGNARFWSKADF